MSNDYYPAGVTDAHPHFNPQEGSVYLACGNDEAKVVPVHAAIEDLNALRKQLHDLSASGWAVSSKDARAVVEKLDGLIEGIAGTAKDSDYECPFAGMVDVAISEEAEWTCPLCGATRVSDTLPEERDPDEEWDRDR